ncbi:hypothetical protein FOPG_17981 [Fusarium oxysporum f. sp. conglutinans race 2 54008]|uniref:Uncharacterized protein n=1 Tax=Fusarium oxysporum f. sp. conglutinans race 2 54008 TaxID=1089457 RepID=X0H159_FUSOX|nr:hypothetical protein FOPG_17981 [Fusarium oxysporum f. sp. conglutinans race 2 54008]
MQRGTRFGYSKPSKCMIRRTKTGASMHKCVSSTEATFAWL